MDEFPSRPEQGDQGFRGHGVGGKCVPLEESVHLKRGRGKNLPPILSKIKKRRVVQGSQAANSSL